MAEAGTGGVAAPAVVVRPGALAALFPGQPRRLEVPPGTLLAVIRDADRLVPGLANRVLDAGPAIREHLRVFVAGRQADLDTVVPPGTEVRVIPAVSGG